MSTELLIRELYVAVLDGVASSGRVRERLQVTGLGRHFAVEPADAFRLAGAGAAAVEAYADDAEETWEERWAVDTDKAWDALHRALAPGSAALSRAVLGGLPLPAGPRLLARLLLPAQVPAVAAALASLTPTRLHHGLRALDRPLDLPYAWERLSALRDFYLRASGAGRGVLFTVDG
ncbi:DUF1877 family protein [Streptomyces sp. NPDC014894]|uniref:DUF1877 family protein n=1 Tax=unclassified Streptomyces TaxID=2593676 RepID=UPI0036F5444F